MDFSSASRSSSDPGPSPIISIIRIIENTDGERRGNIPGALRAK